MEFLQILIVKCQTFSTSFPASVGSVGLYQGTQAEDSSHGLLTTEAWTARQKKKDWHARFLFRELRFFWELSFSIIGEKKPFTHDNN